MTNQLTVASVPVRRWFQALAAVACLALTPLLATAADPANEFSNPRIDIGVVAKDANRTAKFLTNAIGFKEVKGFSVTPDLGRKIGLVDGYSAEVRVFVLDDGDNATRIKLLSFPEAKTQQPDQRFIHSTFGMRYLTLYVKDINQSLARLKTAGVPLEGQTPLDLGEGTYIIVVRDPDGTFYELIGPMKK
jgi:catechol 2,3-dioxygenase-like lactoylglutathione lyase family enzyme